MCTGRWLLAIRLAPLRSRPTAASGLHLASFSPPAASKSYRPSKPSRMQRPFMTVLASFSWYVSDGKTQIVLRLVIIFQARLTISWSTQGWFVFTTILLLATLRSTVAFFGLFFFLDLTFLLLAIAYLHRDALGAPNLPILKAGGLFGFLTSFTAWYNALAGILDDTNRYDGVSTFTFGLLDIMASSMLTIYVPD